MVTFWTYAGESGTTFNVHFDKTFYLIILLMNTSFHLVGAQYACLVVQLYQPYMFANGTKSQR